MPINKNREDFRFYNIWCDMKTRCNNPKCKKYYLYGGRGITICDEWNDYKNFYEDMWESYQKHALEFGEKDTTIDRIDSNDGYYKFNCRWATRKQQRINTRNKSHYEVTKIETNETFIINNLTDFCKQNNLTRQNVVKCLTGERNTHKGYIFKRIGEKERYT